MKVVNFDYLRQVINCESAVIKNISTHAATFVIGDTGSGKSTLINLLIGKKLEVVKVKKGLKSILTFKSSDGGPKIGESSVSETTTPQFWRDDLGNYYVDCPGFSDTKSIEQEIVNAFLVKKVFSKIPKMKIILVISENQLTSDRQKDIINLFQGLTEMFDDVSILKNSLGVVVTKASTDISSEEVKNELLRVKEEHVKNSGSTKFNLKKFSDLWDIIADSPISVFYNPNREGTFSYTNDLIRIKDLLSYNSIININIGISSEAKSALFRDSDFLVKNLTNYMSKFSSKVKLAAESYKISDNIGSANRLNELLGSILKFDRMKIDKENCDSLSYVNSINDVCNYIDFDIKITAYDIEVLNFVKKLILNDSSFRISDIIIGELISSTTVTSSCISQIQNSLEEKENTKKALELQKKNEEIQKQNEIKSANIAFEHTEICYKNDNYPDAIDSITKAIPIFEKYCMRSYKHYEILGKCKIQLNYSKSEIDEIFEKAADIVTNPYLIMFTKGDEYLKIKKYNLSISSYESALNLVHSNSERGECYNRIGNIYHNNKSDYITAAKYYKDAYLNTNDSSDEALYKSNEANSWKCLASNSSAIDDKIKYYKESISCYETAYSKEPDQKYKKNKASVLNLIGNIYHNNKSDYITAAKYYKDACLNTNDSSDEALYKSNEANSWKCLASNSSAVDDKIRYYKESISCYETAYSKKSEQEYKNNEAWSHNSLGWIYYNKEWWNSAYDEFKIAYQLSNKSEDYNTFKKNANDCFGFFSGADGGRQKINFVHDIKYDNPVLNNPELFTYLTAHFGVNKTLELGYGMSNEVIQYVLETNNYELVLAGLLLSVEDF